MGNATDSHPYPVSLRHRAAALASHVGHSRGERTAAARAAQQAQLRHEIEARFPGLTEDEIVRRTDILRRQRLTEMSAKAAAVRSHRKVRRAADRAGARMGPAAVEQ